MKKAVIITARTQSNRFPGKILKKISGKKISIDILNFLKQHPKVEISLFISYEVPADISRGQKSVILHAKKLGIKVKSNETKFNTSKKIINHVKKNRPDSEIRKESGPRMCDDINRYLADMDMPDAKVQIKNIAQSAEIYYQEQQEWPDGWEQMRDEGYLDIKTSTTRKWEFELDPPSVDGGVLSGGTIRATSLPDMAGGEGKELTFNWEEGNYTGYGQKDQGGQ